MEQMDVHESEMRLPRICPSRDGKSTDIVLLEPIESIKDLSG